LISVTAASEQTAALLAFKRERLLGAVEDVEPVRGVPGAVALTTPSLPNVWELNLLLAAPALGADEVAGMFAACEEVQGASGLLHRKLRLSEARDRDEQAVGAGARRLGWRFDNELLMVRRRAPDRGPVGGGVTDVDPDAVARASELFLRREPHGRNPDVRRQLVAQYERWEASAPRARRLGVVQDGRVVAWCRLYEDGRLTEIDDVSVLHDQRGRGLGRMLIEAALAEVPDDRVLFLCADPDDWPQRLYSRLGFEVVGRRVGATRADPP
jgi:ribosomal protein S18 acetylase RimI-like enzyme